MSRMREIRLSGSEGGVGQSNAPSLPLSVKAFDPCMGSGHFVVVLFERLVALRLAEEKPRSVSVRAAPPPA